MDEMGDKIKPPKTNFKSYLTEVSGPDSDAICGFRRIYAFFIVFQIDNETADESVLRPKLLPGAHSFLFSCLDNAMIARLLFILYRFVTPIGFF